MINKVAAGMRKVLKEERLRNEMKDEMKTDVFF
jgi:hypothetical protein